MHLRFRYHKQVSSLFYNTILFICYFVVTLEIKKEFKRESSDIKKYVNLIIEFSINRVRTIINY